VGRGLDRAARRAVLQQIAPQYQNASPPQKKRVLEGFLAATGYVRKYAAWLLNHAEEVLQTGDAAHDHYGPEVQQALVLAWKTLNRICAKRVIPFLPSMLDSLEQHGYLQLSEESRCQLLSMSAATADRLLRAHRYVCPRGVSTTKAGPLLKQQIPIRTFAQWDEAQPGFLEADLVAHCGGHSEGGCLYTITLTDVATGWTECLPLLNRGREAVLAALQRARTLFPFPIQGIDTDNGGEFLNEEVTAYCEREQITFTRGRPYEKRDQCFVEQKNGVVVRQVVGHGRLVGEHASQQLAELYRALRLYVNCFQPSMKLVAKHIEGRKIHRVYDAARTPLQRLLLSGILTTSRQQELSAVAKALDPIRLFHQVERLQQATFRCEINGSAVGQQALATALVPFELEGVTTELFSGGTRGSDEGGIPPRDYREPPESTHVLDWRHTRNDPFVGQWEQILSWVQADPTRSSGDIFRELQSRCPGRYQPGHLRTLQRGMRKIRTYVLVTREEPRHHDVIHAGPTLVEFPQAKPLPEEALHRASRFTPRRPGETSTGFSHACPTAEEPAGSLSGKAACSLVPALIASESEASQNVHFPSVARVLTTPEHRAFSPRRSHPLTIEQAIHSYLQAHHTARHRPKTLEWHQTALRQLQHYLLAQRHLLEVSQITETDIRSWVTSLSQTPTPAGRERSRSTIETYTRSARAFCSWLVHQGVLTCSPMSEGAFPRASVPLPHVVPPERFEQFVHASCSSEANALTAKRDRALLWVLFETGITLSEVCTLRLADVDPTIGMLSVRGKGGKIRRMSLGSTCLSYLCSYLDQAHPAKKNSMARRKTGDDPLFVSEQDHALTKSSLTSLVSRLRTRAESSEIAITPQLLRHSFALRYLQAGGDPRGLQELLGYEGMAQVKLYLRWQSQLLHNRAEQSSTDLIER
jgi:site-specific recombinase XerD